MARSKLFSLLAVVAALSSLVQMGIMSVLPQFLKLTLAYTKSDLVRILPLASADSCDLILVMQHDQVDRYVQSMGV